MTVSGALLLLCFAVQSVVSDYANTVPLSDNRNFIKTTFDETLGFGGSSGVNGGLDSASGLNDGFATSSGVNGGFATSSEGSGGAEIGEGVNAGGLSASANSGQRGGVISGGDTHRCATTTSTVTVAKVVYTTVTKLEHSVSVIVETRYVTATVRTPLITTLTQTNVAVVGGSLGYQRAPLEVTSYQVRTNQLLNTIYRSLLTHVSVTNTVNNYITVSETKQRKITNTVTVTRFNRYLISTTQTKTVLTEKTSTLTAVVTETRLTTSTIPQITKLTTVETKTIDVTEALEPSTVTVISRVCPTATPIPRQPQQENQRPGGSFFASQANFGNGAQQDRRQQFAFISRKAGAGFQQQTRFQGAGRREQESSKQNNIVGNTRVRANRHHY